MISNDKKYKVSINVVQNWVPHLLSAVQVHTTAHCRFYRGQQLGLSPPKVLVPTVVIGASFLITGTQLHDNMISNDKKYKVSINVDQI
jgi:hypothetical protein